MTDLREKRLRALCCKDSGNCHGSDDHCCVRDCPTICRGFETKLAAHDDVLEAAGYVIVPKEPTKEMQDNGVMVYLDTDPRVEFNEEMVAKIYKDMLAAAQKVKP